MRITPPVPVSTTSSRAERDLHALLKVISLPGHVAVHSLLLADHPYKRWGEIDFLIVGPLGVLAIEVKGGGVACYDGIWEFTDRYGEVHRRTESPMRQASSALMALRTWMLERLPQPLVDQISFGWGVAFPDTTFTQGSPEWDPGCIGDRRYVSDASRLERWLRNLLAHWQTRNARPRPLGDDLVQQLLRVIRPEFELVPSLASTVSRLVEQSNHVTETQLEILDAALDNERLLVEGGAGTGKSFVAAELARRRAALFPGEDLAIVVPWPTAALPFRGVVPPQVVVLVGESHAERRYDFVIVDEAQDFMTGAGIDYLDDVVSGGLQRGHWAVFLDSNAQRGLRRQFDPGAYALLLDSHRGKLTLKRNLRNSHEIVAYVSDATGADIGVAGGGHGPDVTLDLLTVPEDFGRHAARRLSDLRRDGVVPEEVVVLTWLDPANVASEIDGRPWRALAVRTVEDLLPVEGVVRVCDPTMFQGLEAVHVLLGPVPADDSSVGMSTTYVGGTRARANLVFLATREAIDHLASRAVAKGGRG
jgi:hypothetical protein